MIVAQRASAILFNFLKSVDNGGYYLVPVNCCEVIPFTFIKAGIRYRFVDISSSHLCIDYKSICRYLDDKDLQGIIFIYTYGIEKDFSNLFEKIRGHREDLRIIEDKCLCKPNLSIMQLNQFTDMVLYSTGRGKFCDIGFGGYAFMSPKFILRRYCHKFDRLALADLENRYREAISIKDIEEAIFANWLNCSELDVDISRYVNEVSKECNLIEQYKEKINKIYVSKLPQEIFLLVEDSPVCKWRFNILVSEKEMLLEKIFKANLFASSHYKVPNIFSSSSNHEYPVAKSLSDSVINLFNDRFFTSDMAEKISDIIVEHIQELN